MNEFSRRAMLSLALVAVCSRIAMASDLVAPSGEVVLTIKGLIGKSNNGDAADFDLAMLQALPMTSFRTSSPWTEAGTLFEGVSLKDLLLAVGATGTTLTASAINDYSVPLPVVEAVEAGAIVAYKVNGEYMALREKGPLWIIFPFDDSPALKTEANYSRSVWQLSSLTVEN